MAFTTLPSMETVTPLGTGIGRMPMRDSFAFTFSARRLNEERALASMVAALRVLLLLLLAQRDGTSACRCGDREGAVLSAWIERSGDRRRRALSAAGGRRGRLFWVDWGKRFAIGLAMRRWMGRAAELAFKVLGCGQDGQWWAAGP